MASIQNVVIKTGFKAIYCNFLRDSTVNKGKNLLESHNVYDVEEYDGVITGKVNRQTTVNASPYNVLIKEEEYGSHSRPSSVQTQPDNWDDQGQDNSQLKTASQDQGQTSDGVDDYDMSTHEMDRNQDINEDENYGQDILDDHGQRSDHNLQHPIEMIVLKPEKGVGEEEEEEEEEEGQQQQQHGLIVEGIQVKKDEIEEDTLIHNESFRSHSSYIKPDYSKVENVDAIEEGESNEKYNSPFTMIQMQVSSPNNIVTTIENTKSESKCSVLDAQNMSAGTVGEQCSQTSFEHVKETLDKLLPERDPYHDINKPALLIENAQQNLIGTEKYRELIPCNLYGESFNNTKELSIHSETHTGEHPYNRFEFNDKSHLTTHLETHSGERPYSCETCGNTFKHKKTLTRHLLTHTGERPFSCEFCEKTFARKSNLVIHLRSHTGERPFSCELCGKKFNQKSNLATHLQTHSGKKPYKCEFCDHKTSNKYNCNQHQKSQHTGEQQSHQQQQQQQQHGRIVEGIQVKKDEVEEDKLIHNESFPSHSSYIKPDYSKVENVEAIEEGESNEKYNSPFTMIQMQVSSPNNIVTTIENTKSESECSVLDAQNMSAGTVGEQCSQTSFECVKETLDKLLPGLDPYHDINKPALLIENTQQNLIGTEKYRELMPCNLYGESFNNTKELSIHSETHTGEHPYNRCEFNDKSHLATHLETHTGERPYSCETCSKTFKHKKTLTTHLLTHTGERPFSCEICEKKFRQKAHLATHLETHTGERPYSCETCSKTFKHKKTLTRHLLAHTTERPFRCEFCDKKFKTKYDLLIHLRLHTGERPFSCKLCKKKYIKKSQLKFHLQTHSGEKPYKCEFCDYKTSNKYNCNQHKKSQHTEKAYLTRHLLTLSGERPFGCELCDKKFKTKYDLVIHLHLHTGERPFSCKLCEKKYIKKSQLKIHLQTHSGEKPYKCEFCDYKTSSKSDLNKHQRRKHKGETYYRCHCRSSSVQTQPDNWDGQGPDNPQLMTESQDQGQASGSVDDSEMSNHEMDQIQDITEDEKYGQDILDCHGQRSDHNLQHPIEMIVLKPEKEVGEEEEEQQQQQQSQQLQQQQHGRIVEGIQVEKDEMEEDTFIHNQSFPSHSSYIKLDHSKVDNVVAIIGKGKSNEKHNSSSIIMQDILDCHGQCPDHNNLQHPIEMIVLKPEKWVGEEEEEGQQQQHEPHQQQQQQQHGLIVEGIKVKKDEMEEDTLIHNQSFHSHSSYMKPDHLKVENLEAIEEGESNEKYNPPSTMMQLQDSSPDNIITAIENTKSESECPVLNTQYMSARTVREQHNQTSFECVKETLDNLLPRPVPYHDRNKPDLLLENAQPNLIGTENCGELKPCNLYGELFNNTRELSFHSETHTGEHPYTRYEFNDKSHLTTDLQTHTVERSYSCETCGKTFQQKGSLTTHLLTHTGEKPFRCEVCDKTFNQKANLTRHLLTHTEERPFSCEFCDKTFKEKSTLITHLHLHTGERPYGCEFCEKTFIAKSHLVAHLPTHTGERPFRCEFCDKKFRTKYILGIHLRLHTGERPFSCKLCEKKYIKESHLKFHLRTHSGEKPYKCEFCDYKTSNKYNCNQHQKRQHTGEQQSQQQQQQQQHGRIVEGIQVKKDEIEEDTLIHNQSFPSHSSNIKPDYSKAKNLEAIQEGESNEKYNSPSTMMQIQDSSPDNIVTAIENTKSESECPVLDTQYLSARTVQDTSDHNNLQHPIEMIVLKPAKEVEKEEEEQHQQQSQQLQQQQQQHGRIVEGIQVEKDVMEKHTGEKPFSCEFCDKKFRIKPQLVQHLRLHTGERPYSCEICNKTFNQKSTLVTHLYVHTGERPYSCEICNKTFIKKSHLVTHLRAHTGERPFSCEYCDKKFRIQSNLVRHSRLHTGERPFSCELCERKFMRKAHLATHLQTHSGEKPYKCEFCDYKTSNKYNCNQHQKSQHTGEQQSQQQQQKQQHGRIVEGIQVEKDEMEDDTFYHNQSFHSHSSYMEPDHSKVENVEAIEEGESNEKYNSPSTMMQIQDSSPDNIVTAIENTKSESECPVLNTQYMSARTVQDTSDHNNLQHPIEMIVLKPAKEVGKEEEQHQQQSQQLQQQQHGRIVEGIQVEKDEMEEDTFIHNQIFPSHSSYIKPDHSKVENVVAIVGEGESNEKHNSPSIIMQDILDCHVQCSDHNNLQHPIEMIVLKPEKEVGEEEEEEQQQSHQQQHQQQQHGRIVEGIQVKKDEIEEDTLIHNQSFHSHSSYMKPDHLKVENVEAIEEGESNEKYNPPSTIMQIQDSSPDNIITAIENTKSESECPVLDTQYMIARTVREQCSQTSFECVKRNLNNLFPRLDPYHDRNKAASLIETITQQNLIGTEKYREIMPCNFYGESFNNTRELSFHSETHAGEHPYNRYEFNDKSHLTTDLQTHTGESPFSCETCGETFKHKQLLTRHLLTHTGERPYSCEFCDKTFKKKTTLTTHLHLHTGERPYACEFCEKTFITKSHLVAHLPTHTGERPFRCEFCDKKFRTKYILGIHLRLHTGERPFSCKLCKKKYIKESQLKFHLQTHSGEKPYKCEFCDYKTSYKYDCIKHQKRQHTGCHSRSSSVQTQPDNWEGRGQDNSQLMTESQDQGQASDGVDKSDMSTHELDQNQDINEDENCGQDILNYHGQCSDHNLQHPIEMIVLKPEKEVGEEEEDQQQQSQQLQQQQHGRLVEGIQVKKDEIVEDTLIHNESFPSHSSYIKPDYSKVENVDAIKEGESNDKYNPPSTMMQIQDSSPDNIITAIENTKSESECSVLDAQNMSAGTVGEQTLTGERPYSCETCGKTFKHKKLLTRHFLKHTGQRPFSCEFCDKKFRTKATLTTHLHLHTGERPYGCKYCEKTYITKSHLVAHLPTHTGERRFSCEFCEKTFMSSSYLVKHLRSHTGERPFSCEMCGKKFIQKQHLATHLQTHSGEKPYKCEFCDYKTSNKYDCKNHQRRQHTGCHSRSSSFQTQPYNWNGRGLNNSQLMTESQDQAQASGSVDDSKMSNHEMNQNQDVIEDEKYGQVSLDYHGQRSDHNLQHPIEMILLKPEKEVGEEEEEEQQQQSQQLQQQQHGRTVEGIQVEKDEMEEDTFIHNQSFPSHSSYIKLDHSKVENIVAIIGEGESDEKHNSSSIIMQDILDCHGQCPDHNNLQHPIEMIVLKPEKGVGEEEEEGQQQQHEPHQQQQHGLIVEGIKVKKYEMEENTLIHNQTFTSHKSYIKQDHSKVENVEAIEEGELNEKHNSSTTMMQIQDSSPDNIVTAIDNTKSESECHVLDTQYMSARTFIDRRSHTSFECVKETLDNLLPRLDPYDRNKPASLIENAQQNLIGTEKYREIMPCNFYGESFNNTRELSFHSETHTGEHPYNRYEFNDKSHLTTHLQTCTGERPYSCETCGKTFKHKQLLTRHLLTHTGERPYSCELCDKTFARKSNLNKHLHLHTGQRPFSCEFCDKTFKEKTTLTTHLHLHTGERPYGCKFCEKTFIAKSHLVAHLPTHTGERLFSCEFCEKTFMSNSNLVIHLRSHTGERPFSCELCEKKFIQKHHLATHLLTHSGEKPYKCEFCDYQTSNKYDCKNHQRRQHTGETYYRCQLCGYICSNPSSFATHQSSHAGVQPHSSGVSVGYDESSNPSISQVSDNPQFILPTL